MSMKNMFNNFKMLITLKERYLVGLFHYGELEFSESILEMCSSDGKVTQDICRMLGKHISGNWGLIDKKTAETNRDAIFSYIDPIHSRYKYGNCYVEIITNPHRKVTNISTSL